MLAVCRALVLATDPVPLKETYGANITEIVNGPFQPGSAYYSDTAYPAYNQSEARSIISQYKAQTGTAGPLTIRRARAGRRAGPGSRPRDGDSQCQLR